MNKIETVDSQRTEEPSEKNGGRPAPRRQQNLPGAFLTGGDRFAKSVLDLDPRPEQVECVPVDKDTTRGIGGARARDQEDGVDKRPNPASAQHQQFEDSQADITEIEPIRPEVAQPQRQKDGRSLALGRDRDDSFSCHAFSLLRSRDPENEPRPRSPPIRARPPHRTTRPLSPESHRPIINGNATTLSGFSS